jgi:hydrogenase-4 component B
VFLGKADENLAVEEVPASMIVPQVVLAALCVVLGVFPQLALRFIGQVVESVSGIPASAVEASTVWGGVALIDNGPVAFWWPLAALAGLSILALLAFAIQRAGKAAVRSVPVWYCGEEHAPAVVRYPASSFYLPFKHAVQGVYPTGKLPVPRLPAPIRRLLDFDRWAYTPATHAIEKAAGGLSRTHVGTPQIYLLWIVLGAVVVAAITLLMAQ